ncbi:MAG: glutamate-1-semialdehyde 2,1-aminomutase [Halarcobacter sp.]
MNITKSQNAIKEAQKLMPGGVNSPVRACISVGTTPIFIKDGKGGKIYDLDDNSYVDYVQSWGPLLFGHRDEDIEKAVIEAVSHGLSFGAPTLVESQLAQEVISLFDSIEKIRFVSSGTEAVMSAIRLARGYTNRDDIIKFEGCYHGHSDSLLVQTGGGATDCGTPSSPGVPADFTKHTLLSKYNDIESVKKHFKKGNNIACIIVEPIAGNMGLVPAKKEFLKELRELCDENGSLLIFDEVMSGFRTSLNGTESKVSVKPDLVTLGKVLGGGMPVGAFGGKEEILNYLAPQGPVYQAGTLSGNPIAMAAGLASIRKLKANPQLIDILEKRAKTLVSGMKEAAKQNNITMQTEVRGSIFGIFFNDKEVTNFEIATQSKIEIFKKFYKGMLEKGFYFASSQLETGFISLQTTDEMIEDTIKASQEVFATI